MVYTIYPTYPRPSLGIWSDCYNIVLFMDLEAEIMSFDWPKLSKVLIIYVGYLIEFCKALYYIAVSC